MSQMRTMPKAPTGLSGLTQLAKALCMPHEYPAQRLPSFPQLERSAVIAVEHSLPLNVAAQGATIGTRLWISRQAAWPCMADATGQYLNMNVERFYGGTAAAGVSGAFALSDGQHCASLSGPQTLTVPTPNGLTYTLNAPTTSTPPWAYGSTLSASDAALYGLVGNNSFIYVPPNSSASTVPLAAQVMVMAAAGSSITGLTGSFSLVYSYWVEGDSVGQVTVGPTTVTPSVYVTNAVVAATPSGVVANVLPGWYRLESIVGNFTAATGTVGAIDVVYGGGSATVVFTSTPATSTLSASVASGTALWPLAPPPAWSVSSVPYSNTRVTAVGVLATNVTKALNKEGTINAGRLLPSNSGLNYGISLLASLHPQERAYLGLENGFYTYLPPSTDLQHWADYSWITPNFIGQAATRPIFRLDNPGWWHCVSFNDPDGGTALALNVDWHLEFRSNSILWPIGVSAITLEGMHQALVAMSRTGYFFDNPDHKKLLSIALKVATAIAPHFGKMLELGHAAYQAKKGRKPKDTSAPKPSVLHVKVAQQQAAGGGGGKSNKGKGKGSQPQSEKKKGKKK